MEKIKINGKEYELYFGLAFIRELDKRCELRGEGVKAGFGVGQTYIDLNNMNPVALANCIQAATITGPEAISDEEVEGLIDELFAKGELEELYESFLRILEQSSLTAPTIQVYRHLGGLMGQAIRGVIEEKDASKAKSKASTRKTSTKGR